MQTGEYSQLPTMPFSYSRCYSSLTRLSIAELNLRLTNKTATPTTVLSQCLSSIRERDPHVHAFVGLENEQALIAESAESDTRWNRGNPLSNLDGVPIAIKDNFCTTTISTSCGSNILKDFISPYDATVVRLLKKAGAVVIGKTNLDEFAMGSANVYSRFGPVFNPHGDASRDPSEQRVAGGSSGGSAAAVATGMCFAALGSDTGGSVRLPASYCGVVGFKPSYGRCSRWGLIAYANSLDTVGVLARTVRDVETVYDFISEYDERDPTSIPIDIRKRIEAVTPGFEPKSKDPDDLAGLRVGIPQEYFVSELAPSIIRLWRDGIAHLRARGASIVPVSMPNTRHALSAYYVLAPAEASSNLARFDGVRYGYRSDSEDAEGENTLPYSDTRTEGFGPEVRRRIILGTYVLTAGSYKNYFLQSQKVRRLVQQDFDRVFLLRNPIHASPAFSTISGVHVLLTPSAISTAPRLDDYLTGASTMDAYVGDAMTVPVSLAGVPAVSVPFGVSPEDGLPVGLQLVAQYGDERTLLRVAAALERG